MHASARHAFSALFEGVPGAHNDNTLVCGVLPIELLLLKILGLTTSKADGLSKILQRTKGSKYSKTNIVETYVVETYYYSETKF